MSLQIQIYKGAEAASHIQSMGELRIKVFSEFPYLYDGDLEYEKKYLQRYFQSEKSIVVCAFDHHKMIGVSTGQPLSLELSEIQKPFLENHLDVLNYFYFGESVLLPEYRGQGLGHAFFDQREEFANDLGYSLTAFCSVERDKKHPLKPESYRKLDSFWKSRGYTKQDQLNCYLNWKDLNEATESQKKLTFWVKEWPK